MRTKTMLLKKCLGSQSLIKITLNYLCHIIVIFLCLVCSNCGKDSSVQPEENLPLLAVDSLQSALDNYLEDTPGILGCPYQIDLAGYQPWNGVSGYFDNSRAERLKWDDKFLIGSITKSFTAVIVLQLWEEGQVELDNPIINYMPAEIGNALQEIDYGNIMTVRQVLKHLSGIRNYMTFGVAAEIYADPGREWTVIEILEIVRNVGPPDFYPGDDYRYSNTNFVLLGSLIENVTGRNYRDVLEQNILSRINLENSFLPELVPLGNYDGVAHGYEDDFHDLLGGRTLDALELNSGTAWAWSAGGMISTTEDLNTFFRALDNNMLFASDSTFQMMIEDTANHHYGMGIVINTDPALGLYYGHAGGQVGFRSYAYYFPEHDLAVSGSINLDGSVEYIPVGELRQILLEKLPVYQQ